MLGKQAASIIIPLLKPGKNPTKSTATETARIDKRIMNITRKNGKPQTQIATRKKTC